VRGKCGTEKYSVILQRKWLGRLSLAAAPAQDLRDLRLLLLPAPGDGIDALGPMRIIMLRDRGAYPLRGRAAPVGRGAVHIGQPPFPAGHMPAVGLLPFLTVRISSLLFFCVCDWPGPPWVPQRRRKPVSPEPHGLGGESQLSAGVSDGCPPAPPPLFCPQASGAGDNFVASFKLLLIGDSNVGKSCLASRFVSDRFSFALKPTIGTLVSGAALNG
jgi:hypothetical protein